MHMPVVILFFIELGNRVSLLFVKLRPSLTQSRSSIPLRRFVEQNYGL